MNNSKLFNIFNNGITKYDEMIYESRPVKFNEYISNKYNNIHIELFNDALKKFYIDKINSNINEKFVYDFFRIMSGLYEKDNQYSLEESFELFWNKLTNKYNENNKPICFDAIEYIKNTINKELSLNQYECYKEMFILINLYINDLKDKIVEHNVINNVFSIFDINDFRIVYEKTINNSTYLELEKEDENSHEFLSYEIIRETNNNESTYTYIEKDFLMSELEDYIFILECDGGIRIGYNIEGKFMLFLDGNNFNETQDPLNIFDFTKYVNNINKNIVNQLQSIALKYYKNSHKIIEKKNTEYWKPSSIVVISNIYPYTKYIYDLTKYWNTNQSMEDLNIEDIKLTDSQIKDAEILEINYVRGTVKLASKLLDLEFEVPFEYLNKNVNVSEDFSLDLIK